MTNKFLDVIHNKYTAWIILFCSLVLTLGAWLVSKQYAYTIANDKFELRTDELVFAIEQRMSYYEQTLWGGVGLFYGSDSVTRKNWDEYITAINLSDRLPGIQGLGYAVPLLGNKAKKQFEFKIQQEGFADFTVKPTDERPKYTSILFISPFDWRNKRAFGYDMYSNSIRREAMDLAGSSGKASISGIITLVQETDDDMQKGFLTYVPVYKSSKDKELKGWVYAAFRANDLFQNIFGEEDQNFEFQIFDSKEGIEENMLYSSNATFNLKELKNNAYVKNLKLNIQGRTWMLQIFAKPSFTNNSEANLPNFVVIGGLFIDLLLFYVIFALYNLHNKAKEMAKKMTSEVDAKSKELLDINNELRQFAYATTHDVKSPVNSIANFVGLLKEDKTITNEMSLEAINWIEQSCDKALGTIQSLVNIVELKEVKRFEMVNIRIEPVVANILASFKLELDRIRGAIAFTNSITSVYFNPAYFNIVLENLISNAIKYRENARELDIKLNLYSENEYDVLSIKDNGIGIDLVKYEAKVFGLFKRAHDHVEGSGFGLYMVKNVLEKEGGFIKVESAVGVGSTFYVYFKKADEKN